MRIVSATGEFFRCFHRIDWSFPAAGSTLIDGHNQDTGRSNMTGKSTLPEFIFWVLFGWLAKWKGPKGGSQDDVITRGKSRAWGRVEIEHDGKNVVIERQRPAKVKITVDGIPVDLKKKTAEETIEELIGMSAAQFLIASFFNQGRSNSFFTMGEADRARFLSVIAGLEDLDRGLAKAKQDRDTAESELNRLEGSIKVLKEQLDEIPVKVAARQTAADEAEKRLVEVTERSAELYRLAIAETDRAEKELATEIAGLQAVFTSKHATLSRIFQELKDQRDALALKLKQAPVLEQSYVQAIYDIKFGITQAENFNKEQDKIERENEKAQEAAERELNLAEGAQTGKCSHCKQDLPTWDRERAAQDHIKLAQSFQMSIRPVQDRLSLEPLQAELEAAQQAYSARRAEIEAAPRQLNIELGAVDARLRAASTELEVLTKQFKSDKSAAEQKLNQQVRDWNSKAQTAAREVSFEEQAVLNALRELGDTQAQADTLKAKLADVHAKEAVQEVEWAIALDLMDFFGPKGVRAIFYDDLLARISDEANRLLGIMTDGVYSTRLDQVGEDSKGAQKLTLRPVVIKGGVEVPLDDLSGAAETTFIMAYDVAVSQAICQGTPLFVDELLGPMDAIGKQEAMRLLEEVSRTRPVFVIDHGSELKSSFSNVIMVLHKDGASAMSAS